MKKLLLLILPLLLLTSCGSKPSQSQVEPEPMEVEPTAAYYKEDKTFYRDNQKIVGELYIPDNEQEIFPLLVLSHGFNNNMDNTRNDAITFTKAGYMTFIFDFIGGAQSKKSDGQMTEMSVLTEASDLNIVIDELKEDERVVDDYIFVAGQSQGGFVSTYIACTREDIRGLIGFYPAYVLQDDALKQYSKLEDVPDTYVSAIGIRVGKIYWQDATSFDIYELMKDCEVPSLIIHGTADNIVPYSYAERAVETLPNAELLTIPGAGHGFSGQNNLTAMNRAIEFLNDNL